MSVFLNFVFGPEIHIFIPKFGQNFTFLFLKVPIGRGSTGLGNIPKKVIFYCFPNKHKL